MKDKVSSGVMGLCVADALGVPVEFNNRNRLIKDPVINMRSYGTYNQPAGTWSDDTSMTLCLVDSLSAGLNYNWIMKNFSIWLSEGAYTPHGVVFDVGIATKKALDRYKSGTRPLDCGGTSESDNGNGSLMRILPILFHIIPMYGMHFNENEEAMEVIHNVSALTHAHKRSLIACGIYISIAAELISTQNPELERKIEIGIFKAMEFYRKQDAFLEDLRHYERLSKADFKMTEEEQIKSSGYVVDTLEAAIWCLLNTNSYEECVLKAVNLGEDTDTVAAVAGGLAGLFYGYENIPQEWLAVIVKREYLEALCNKMDTVFIINSVEKLYRYVPFLERMQRYQRERVEQGLDPYEPGCPVCADILGEFLEECYKSSLFQYEYPVILERSNFDHSEEAIDNADLELASAIFTLRLRAHRHSAPCIESLVDESLIRSLKRLHQIAN